MLFYQALTFSMCFFETTLQCLFLRVADKQTYLLTARLFFIYAFSNLQRVLGERERGLSDSLRLGILSTDKRADGQTLGAGLPG
jgi:hypothetical protein